MRARPRREFSARALATVACLVALLLTLCLPTAAHARDAAHCIVLGESKEDKSRTLTNTCHAEVMVFWCHHGDRKGTRDAACDRAKSFYRQQTPLKPAEVKTNRFSLPIGDDVTYGACFGSYSSFSLLDNTGAYYCHPERVGPAGKNQTLLITMSGKDQDEVCAEALASARTYGTPGECACQSWGPGRAFCRVEVTNAKVQKAGKISQLKALIRESLTCDPAKDADCKPRPSRQVAIGIRG